MDISIIITAHDEGLLAHKTLLSVSEAINKLKKSIKTEIIIHIDKGTPDTIKYFKSHKDNFDLTIYENNFGDLGLSRNFAIKRASGKYVFLMDADDLISENLFAKAYEQMEKSENDILLHPNYVLSFGEYRTYLYNGFKCWSYYFSSSILYRHYEPSVFERRR